MKYQLYFGGEAVFRARAILGIDVDDTELALRLGENSTVDNSNNHSKELLVIPNPTTGRVTIKYELSEEESAEMQIIDPLGKVLQRKILALNSKLESIDLSNHQTGFYTLKIMTSKGRILIQKLVLIK